MPWIKKGTCPICGKRLVLLKANMLPKHKYKKETCPRSNRPGKDHKLEWREK